MCRWAGGAGVKMCRRYRGIAEEVLRCCAAVLLCTTVQSCAELFRCAGAEVQMQRCSGAEVQEEV